MIEVVHRNFSQKRKQGESDLISSHQIFFSGILGKSTCSLDFSVFFYSRIFFIISCLRKRDFGKQRAGGSERQEREI